MAHGLLEHLLPTARAALQRDQQHHSQQHQAGEFGRGGQTAIAKPGVVDRRGQGVDGKEVDGGEIGQRLHRHQRHRHHDGGARQRQTETAKALPRGTAEQAAGVDQAD